MASMMEKAGLTVNDAFFVTAAFCGLAGALFFMIVRAVRIHSEAQGPEARSSLSLTGVAAVMRSPARLPVIMVCIGASVFAGMNNFQTVFADARGLDYADFFLTYTITVVIFRVLLARFKGGKNPYMTIAALQYVMFGSVLLFLGIGETCRCICWSHFSLASVTGSVTQSSQQWLPMMRIRDLVPQTLQVFALTYFIGIFGFPLIAGWMIVELGASSLLVLVAALAGIEATMALVRSLSVKRATAAAASSH